MARDDFSGAVVHKVVTFKKVIHRDPHIGRSRGEFVYNEDEPVAPRKRRGAVVPGETAVLSRTPAPDQFVLIHAAPARERDDGRIDASEKLKDTGGLSAARGPGYG